MNIEHLMLPVGDLRLYAAAAGPRDGPLVLLLHGFPEFSYGWRHQLAPLAAAGFRVVAPDQRGYGHSDKPEGRQAYRIDALADDIVGLAHAVGHERFSIVGHDWGGALAYHLASRDPWRLQRLAILNAPHPATVLTHAWHSPLQALRSWYVGFFQAPMLPELMLSARGHAGLRSTLEATSRPGTFSAEEMAVYREAWSQPGAVSAMVNWYRALPLGSRHEPGRVRVPTRVIWGDDDAFLDAGLAEKGAQMCDTAEVIHLPDATHWLHHEQPEKVNALLVEFLRG